MPQTTINMIARVTRVIIDNTSDEPQLVIEADLVNAATGLVIKKVRGNPTATLTQAHKDRMAAMVTQAQAWADARLAEALGS